MPRYVKNTKQPLPINKTTAQGLAAEVAKQQQQQQQQQGQRFANPNNSGPPTGPRPNSGPPPLPNQPAGDQRPNLPPQGQRVTPQPVVQTPPKPPTQPSGAMDMLNRQPQGQKQQQSSGVAGAAGNLGQQGGPLGNIQDTTKNAVAAAAQSQKDLAIEAAKSQAKQEAEQKAIKSKAISSAKDKAMQESKDKALANKKEEEQGVDLDGDGKIGMRDMTDEEAIKTATHNLLTEDLDVEKEREAMIGGMKASEARDIQSMRARTGLGGMGLTGAAGGMESQVRTEAGRSQALTTADFDRKARAEALDRLLKGIDVKRSEQVFGAEMDMYEEDARRDIDGDGMIAGKPVDQFLKENPEEPEKTPEERRNIRVQDQIPSNQKETQKAFEQGPVTKKNNRELYNYYVKLPFSAQAFPGEELVDSFVDKNGSVYGVYKNSSGELYSAPYGGFGSMGVWDPTGASDSKR